MAFALVCFLLATVVAIGFYNVKHSQQLLERDLTDAREIEGDALNIRLLLARNAIAIRNMGLASEVQDIQAELKKAQAHEKEYRALLKKIGEAKLSDDEKALIANLTANTEKMQPLLKQAISQALAFDSAATAKIVMTKVEPLFIKSLDEATKLADLQISKGNNALNAVIDFGRTSSRFMLALGIFGLVLAVTCGIWLTRAVIGPLSSALEAAVSVTNCDLTVVVEASGTGELRSLMEHLGEMTRNLDDIVTTVRNSTEQIATASAEIAVGNNDLSIRTDQQASKLKQTAAAILQLTSKVKQNFENAEQARKLANAASVIAVRGGDVVHQVVSTMDEITVASRKIEDIIGVIDGIAFQTNILALNAAVEAARAGEQGRGFAVVASEVRSLAQRSAEAAKEIKTLIGASVEKVDAGKKLVANAGSTMGEIVSSVKNVSDIIGEIRASSLEQNSGISEINNAVIQLDTMTQQNAALVEQGAVAAESLKDQAENQRETMGVFKLARL